MDKGLGLLEQLNKAFWKKKSAEDRPKKYDVQMQEIDDMHGTESEYWSRLNNRSRKKGMGGVESTNGGSCNNVYKLEKVSVQPGQREPEKNDVKNSCKSELLEIRTPLKITGLKPANSKTKTEPYMENNDKSGSRVAVHDRDEGGLKTSLTDGTATPNIGISPTCLGEENIGSFSKGVELGAMNGKSIASGEFINKTDLINVAQAVPVSEHLATDQLFNTTAKIHTVSSSTEVEESFKGNVRKDNGQDVLDEKSNYVRIDHEVSTKNSSDKIIKDKIEIETIDNSQCCYDLPVKNISSEGEKMSRSEAVVLESSSLKTKSVVISAHADEKSVIDLYMGLNVKSVTTMAGECRSNCIVSNLAINDLKTSTKTSNKHSNEDVGNSQESIDSALTNSKLKSDKSNMASANLDENAGLEPVSYSSVNMEGLRENSIAPTLTSRTNEHSTEKTLSKELRCLNLRKKSQVSPDCSDKELLAASIKSEKSICQFSNTENSTQPHVVSTDCPNSSCDATTTLFEKSLSSNCADSLKTRTQVNCSEKMDILPSVDQEKCSDNSDTEIGKTQSAFQDNSLPQTFDANSSSASVREILSVNLPHLNEVRTSLCDWESVTPEQPPTASTLEGTNQAEVVDVKVTERDPRDDDKNNASKEFYSSGKMSSVVENSMSPDSSQSGDKSEKLKKTKSGVVKRMKPPDVDGEKVFGEKRLSRKLSSGCVSPVNDSRRGSGAISPLSPISFNSIHDKILALSKENSKSDIPQKRVPKVKKLDDKALSVVKETSGEKLKEPVKVAPKINSNLQSTILKFGAPSAGAKIPIKKAERPTPESSVKSVVGGLSIKEAATSDSPKLKKKMKPKAPQPPLVVGSPNSEISVSEYSTPASETLEQDIETSTPNAERKVRKAKGKAPPPPRLSDSMVVTVPNMNADNSEQNNSIARKMEIKSKPVDKEEMNKKTEMQTFVNSKDTSTKLETVICLKEVNSYQETLYSIGIQEAKLGENSDDRGADVSETTSKLYSEHIPKKDYDSAAVNKSKVEGEKSKTTEGSQKPAVDVIDCIKPGIGSIVGIDSSLCSNSYPESVVRNQIFEEKFTETEAEESEHTMQKVTKSKNNQETPNFPDCPTTRIRKKPEGVANDVTERTSKINSKHVLKVDHDITAVNEGMLAGGNFRTSETAQASQDEIKKSIYSDIMEPKNETNGNKNKSSTLRADSKTESAVTIKINEEKLNNPTVEDPGQKFLETNLEYADADDRVLLKSLNTKECNNLINGDIRLAWTIPEIKTELHIPGATKDMTDDELTPRPSRKLLNVSHVEYERRKSNDSLTPDIPSESTKTQESMSQRLRDSSDSESFHTPSPRLVDDYPPLFTSKGQQIQTCSQRDQQVMYTYRGDVIGGRLPPLSPERELFTPEGSPLSDFSDDSYDHYVASVDFSVRSSSLPRRIYPQAPRSWSYHEDWKEDSPVVFDARLSFDMGARATPIRQLLRPSPAHIEPRTASNSLSCKIAEFLSRTDHIMDEWKRIGRADPYDIQSLVELPAHRMRGTKKSQSAANIMIKGFQYFSRGNSKSSWRSPSVSKFSEVSDRTLGDLDELHEMTADLSEERSTGSQAADRLDGETKERVRLEQELSQVSERNSKLEQKVEQLEVELYYAKADVNGLSESEGDWDESRDGGVYKQKCARLMREIEMLRSRLQQQHEDDLEQLVGLKKQLEKKLADAYEDVEEHRQVVAQWKRRNQNLQGELNDLRLILDEQASRNNLLEKKQRKFDTEIQSLQDELRSERNLRDRVSREREVAVGEKYALEQSLSSVRLELELKEEKLGGLSRELDELSLGGATEHDISILRKSKHDLEMKAKDQEDELDDLAAQVAILESTKLKLEMSLENIRKEHRKEISQKDDEMEDVRVNCMKKMKAMEMALEQEHSDRTLILREKHELERRLRQEEDQVRNNRAADQDVLTRLRKELRQTKALLRDSYVTIERAKQDSPSKATLRALKNQLEDSELARASAEKAKQTVESELSEVNSQLDDATRTSAEAEAKAQSAMRQSSSLRSQLEENEEELAELMKKYRMVLQNLTQEQNTNQETMASLAEVESERNILREQLAEVTVKLESAAIVDPTSDLNIRRLEAKVKELESRLELEVTVRTRLEVQINRLKENLERITEECNQYRTKESTASDQVRKLQRNLRECKDELALHVQREREANNKRRDLEKRLETAEQEAASARNDLRLSTQRVEDLQLALSAELNSDSDVSSDTEIIDGSEILDSPSLRE